ncbi:hypothetical protein CSC82_20525 [Rhodobacteraceae bacterium 4F10]|nr:hypothetical protein CSC82_20525 [Rhodobacteraceae bacterium 4F10]
MIDLVVFGINIKVLIMKKSILNLGKVLNKTDQKQISGGYPKYLMKRNVKTTVFFNVLMVSFI